MRRNQTLQERCTTDSSCSTYRVGKVQSIFSLPVNKKLFRYSVIPLFRYSIFRVLPTPLITLGWLSEMIMVSMNILTLTLNTLTWTLNTYIIRPMNTKRAQYTCYTQLVIKPYVLVFLLRAARTITLSF